MPLEDAVTMACLVPARHIGLKNELAEGQPAISSCCSKMEGFETNHQ